jgi:hypothetical protein
VTEVPIHWYFDPDSRVDFSDTWHMLLDVLTIRLNDLRGMYDCYTDGQYHQPYIK